MREKNQSAAAPGRLTQSSRNRIAFLDYVRIFSFVNVFNTHIYHGIGNFGSSSNPLVNSILQFCNSMAPHLLGTATGVITFFMISGYIIAEVCTFEDPVKFLVKRAFRIYPLYIFAVMAQFALTDGHIPPWSSLWPRFSLLGDFLGTGHVLNGVDWTLRIEIVFYAYMAALHLFKNSARFESWKAPVMLCTVIACFLLPDLPNSASSTVGAVNHNIPYLILGSLIRYIEKGGSSVFYAIAVAAIALLGPHGVSTIYGMCIFFLAWHYREKMTSNPLVLWISAITYPVYLIHAWYFQFIEDIALRTVHQAVMANILSIAAVVITAWAMGLCVERPMIRIGNKFFATAARFSRLSVGSLRRS